MNDREFADALVWITHSPIISIDCETTGLHPFEWDRVTGIGVANESHQHYFPLRHPDRNLSYGQARNLIEALSLRRERILFHNAIFDWAFLRLEGWSYPEPWQDTWDTMVAAWLLDENAPKKLEEQVSVFAYLESREQIQRQKKIARKGWDKVSAAEIQLYGATDARFTFDLYRSQAPKFAKDAELAVALVREHAFLACCAEMIDNGVRVDDAQAKRKLAECDFGIAQLEDEYPGLNFDSPKQLAELLYSDDGWSIVPTRFTNGGQPSTDKDALMAFLPYEPRIADILSYRKLRKARSTYYVPLVERVGRDGRVHAWYRPHGTKTGRLSCLASWTPIRTTRGTIPISDVRTGDKVFTHRNRWRSVLRQWCVGTEKVFEIVLSNGETVVCTSSHRLLTSYGWQSIEEIICECGEEMGSEPAEPEASRGSLPGYPTFIDDGCSQDAWNDTSQRHASHQGRDDRGRTDGPLFGKKISRKDGNAESDEGENGSQASQLEGCVRRRGWLSHNPLSRQADSGASRADGESLRAVTIAQEVCGASHRWGPQTQRTRQSRPCDPQRSRSYPLLAGEGQRVHRIEAIYARGSCEVYDLSVDEDESYLSCGVFSHNCSDPNLQTLPHEETLPGIKDCFLATDDCSLIEYDISQAELRVAAYYADDCVLREHLAAGDVHSATAMALFGHPDGVHRFVGKTLNFAALYGIGASKFVHTARRNGGEMTEDQARQYLGQWRNLYAGVTQAMHDAQKVAEERGYVKLWPIGRRRHFNGGYAGFENPKDSLNSLVQGGVGEYVKELMLRLRDSAKALDIRLVLNVHDSLVYDVPNGREREWTQHVQQVAAACNPFGDMPMPIGVKKW